MKVRSRLFSFSKNLDSVLAALLGFIIIQYFSKHSGIGVSPDSVTYISASRHLIQGKGFISFDNLPVVDFPFGYPFFLSILSFVTRLDPLQFGAVLNGILFASLLYVSGSAMNGFTNTSVWYKRILLICILLSPALQEVYSLLWSETVFILLTLFFIISISNYLRHLTLRWLLISIIICSIACLTRYAGLFMIMTGLCLIFFNGSLSWRRRIIHCFLFGSLSCSWLLLNMIRNYSATGLAMGLRPKNHVGMLKIFEYFGGVFCDWILADRIPYLAIALALVVFAVFIFTIVFSSSVRKSGNGFEYVAALTGLMYSVFMIITSSLTRYDQFTNRLLSPMFIPLIWSVSWWIPGFVSKKSQYLKWIFGLSFFTVVVLFVRVEYLADYEYYDGVKDAGVPGYREDPFVQSEIVQFLEKNKTAFDPHYPIYSNAGDAVYFVTGMPALQLPFLDYPDKVAKYYIGYNNHMPEYLVWFQDLDNPDMPKLDSILKNKKLALLKQLTDGAVYIAK